jgi:hypothetical protein
VLKSTLAKQGCRSVFKKNTVYKINERSECTPDRIFTVIDIVGSTIIRQITAASIVVDRFGHVDIGRYSGVSVITLGYPYISSSGLVSFTFESNRSGRF